MTAKRHRARASALALSLLGLLAPFALATDQQHRNLLQVKTGQVVDSSRAGSATATATATGTEQTSGVPETFTVWDGPAPYMGAKPAAPGAGSQPGVASKVAIGSSGLITSGGFNCMTPTPSAARLAEADGMMRTWLTSNPQFGFTMDAANTLVARTTTGGTRNGVKTGMRRQLIARAVDVYVGICRTSATAADVTSGQINNQIRVLNNAYSGYFSFTLKGINRLISATDCIMPSGGSTAEWNAKRFLHRGTSRKVLNIFYASSAGTGVLGYSYLPQEINSFDIAWDGVVVAIGTQPGGGTPNYNTGNVVTHEVGHWLGLLHTFAGGCTGSGDGIADTPAEASAGFYCPAGRDTCPNDPGKDPVRNYMDYSYSSCMNSFTDGQRTKMLSMWDLYRAPY